MAYELYTIRQYMNAYYSNDRSVISEEELKTVYTEFIDTAGLYDTEEFEKVSHIQFLNDRINKIKINIRLQRDFLNNFEVPYIPGFRLFKRLGYNLYWNNKEQFLNELDKIQIRDNKFISELETSMKQLIDFRLKKNNKETTVKHDRGSFIRTINSLGKIGYRILMDENTVEELAYMIRQQSEDINYVNAR